MNDEATLTPREEMERRKARLLEEVAAKQAAAAAIDRDIAKWDQLAELAAKYNFVAVETPKPLAIDGSMASLVHIYRTDERSPFLQIRYKTREHYSVLIKRIVTDCGDGTLAELKAQDIQRLYEAWIERGNSIAHHLVTMLRMLFGFGATILQDRECERLSVILHNMRFKFGKPLTVRLTAEHVAAIIGKAHEMRVHSIALAQALQFDCRLRQKDVIGEWVPGSEPGLSDVVKGSDKWIHGIRWSEIDKDLVLRHMPSIGGKPVELRLTQAPMVMAEFDRIRKLQGALPQSGPVIIYEKTKRPYLEHQFRRMWRIVAMAAGVPKEVKNMGSRARPILDPEGDRDQSEADDADLDLSLELGAQPHH
jgi:hypothetical protein